MAMDKQIIATWISDVPIGADPDGPKPSRPSNLRQSTTAPKRYIPEPTPSTNNTTTTTETPDTPQRGGSKRKRKVYEISHITDSRTPLRGDHPDQIHYQVQWAGLPATAASWQPFRDLWPECEEALVEFHTRLGRGKAGWGYFGSCVPLPALPCRRWEGEGERERGVRDERVRVLGRSGGGGGGLEAAGLVGLSVPGVTPTSGTPVRIKTEEESGAEEFDSLTSFSRRHETVYAKPE